MGISTHTPTQGVTHEWADTAADRNFYSHAHAGRDCSHAPFQSPDSNFYSHAHAGRDIFLMICCNCFAISTHTPTQGVTIPIRHPITATAYFYSHAHAGRDQYAAERGTGADYFYSHAHAGRDRPVKYIMWIRLDFYSHAHAGRDGFKNILSPA